jgi:hypothetical protein
MGHRGAVDAAADVFKMQSNFSYGAFSAAKRIPLRSKML